MSHNYIVIASNPHDGRDIERRAGPLSLEQAEAVVVAFAGDGMGWGSIVIRVGGES